MATQFNCCSEDGCLCEEVSELCEVCECDCGCECDEEC